MFSSPTLNIVVLSMLFSIFPPYLIAIKLILTLTFILLLVPLLSRCVFRQERKLSYDDSVCAIEPPSAPPVDESVLAAARGATILLARNLGYVVVRTVPLRLLRISHLLV